MCIRDSCGKALPGKDIHGQASDHSHEDKARQVSAGGTGDLSQSAGKPGKYRKPGQAKKEIDDEADAGILPAQDVYAYQ